MIVLLADPKDINRFTSQPHPGIFDFLKKQTRPTTVIYEGAIGFADNLIAKDGSIAIRVCKDEFCRNLIRRFRKPIVSTSANISGEQSPGNFSAVTEEIRKKVDYVVQYRQDDEATAEPSSLIKWEEGKAIILRS